MLKQSTGFINILKNLLDSPETDHALCWSENGEYVIINNKESLSGILSKYFRTNSFFSFRRQLHMYGFRKMNCKSKSPQLIYKHELFKRGNTDLLRHLTRGSGSINLDNLSPHLQHKNKPQPVLEETAIDSDLRDQVKSLQREVLELRKSHEQLSGKFMAQQQLMIAAIKAIKTCSCQHSTASKNTSNSTSNSTNPNDIIIIVKNPHQNNPYQQHKPSITYEPSTSSDYIKPNTPTDSNSSHMNNTNTNHEATTIQQHYDVFSNSYHNNPCFNFPIYVSESSLLDDEQMDSSQTSPEMFQLENENNIREILNTNSNQLNSGNILNNNQSIFHEFNQINNQILNQPNQKNNQSNHQILNQSNQKNNQSNHQNLNQSNNQNLNQSNYQKNNQILIQSNRQKNNQRFHMNETEQNYQCGSSLVSMISDFGGVDCLTDTIELEVD